MATGVADFPDIRYWRDASIFEAGVYQAYEVRPHK
jgi:hypothetical protein